MLEVSAHLCRLLAINLIPHLTAQGAIRSTIRFFHWSPPKISLVAFFSVWIIHLSNLKKNLFEKHLGIFLIFFRKLLHHAARKFLSQDSARWTDFAIFWKISKNDIEILTVILISVRKGNFCSSSIFFIECYTQTAASCEKWPLVGVFRNYSQFQAFGRLHLPLLFQGHRFFVNLFCKKFRN